MFLWLILKFGPRTGCWECRESWKFFSCSGITWWSSITVESASVVVVRPRGRESVHAMFSMVWSHYSKQWRNIAWGYPWARDGWVPHWLKSLYRPICVQSAHVRRAYEPCGVGFRCPLKGPRWGADAKPWWGFRGRSPQKLFLFFNAETAFSTQIYKSLRKIFTSLRHYLLQKYDNICNTKIIIP